MANSYFQFKQFTIQQDKCAMKVTTDGCLFGAWVASSIKNEKLIINNCLDIGTGTGLLSLMLLQGNSTIIIDAIEIDKEAAEQATENISTSPWADKIKVYHIDAKGFESPGYYNLVFSNPPFYEHELRTGNSQKDIAHHSNELQLKDLLVIIKKNLSPDGIFCLLLPYKRDTEVKNLLNEQGLSIIKITYVRQSTSHDFFRIMIIGKFASAEPGETMIDEIAIKNSAHLYTPAFTNLLKEFYLHL